MCKYTCKFLCTFIVFEHTFELIIMRNITLFTKPVNKFINCCFLSFGHSRIIIIVSEKNIFYMSVFDTIKLLIGVIIYALRVSALKRIDKAKEFISENAGSVIGNDSLNALKKTDAGFNMTPSSDNSYSVAADRIKKIDILWISGSVSIQPYDGDAITFSESSARSIDDNNCLIYKAEGDKLEIRFCHSRRFAEIDFKSFDINDLTASLPSKELIINVPEALCQSGELELFAASVSSAASITGVTADEVKLDSVSGDIVLENVTARDEIQAVSVSADISVVSCSADELKADSVSGSISAAGCFNEVDADSTSGEVSISTENEPKSIDIDSVSGDVKLSVTKEAGFKVDVDTVSGQVITSPGMAQQGSVYTCGDGPAEYEVQTVSGSISIEIK